MVLFYKLQRIFLYIYSRCYNLILYAIIGCFTAGVDFILFTIFSHNLKINYIISNCVSVLVGITLSFILNRTYNFKVKDRVKRRFATFLIIGLCGLCLSNLILWVGIDILYMDKIFTKLASIILVVGFQFLLNKFVTFKK